MTKETANDPWEITSKDAEEMKRLAKGSGGGGIFCPKRNTSINGVCHVCNTIQPFWPLPDSSPERKIALDKGPKVAYFMNAILDSDRTKAFVMEVGKKVGDYIIDSCHDAEAGWGNVVNPRAGIGFLVRIKKIKGDMGFNSYSVYKMNTCDWDIDKEILNNLTDISQSNIIRMLSEGELEENNNFFRIPSLKMDESVLIRICPAFDHMDGGKTILYPVYRHWGGVTQEEVDGVVALNMNLSVRADEEAKTANPTQDLPFMTDDQPQTKTVSNPACWGRIEPVVFYNDEDDDCKACPAFTTCLPEVERRQKKKELKG